MKVGTSVFVRPPRGTAKVSGHEINFDVVQRELIGPALRAAGLGSPEQTAVVDSGALGDGSWADILGASLALFDVTLESAPVFYAVGIRHALRRAGTLLLCGTPRPGNSVPELLVERCITYDWRQPEEARPRLTEAIGAALRQDPSADSPCFHMLPGLVEPGASEFVPPDFHEELERARSAQSKGWLRLLARDVEGLRFQWSGLRLIARAQGQLEDLAGARRCWEAIAREHPDDFEASAELARVYERLYRVEKNPELLELCHVPIERALASEPKSALERAVALALEGEHQAQLWWAESAQRLSMSPRLLHSYESYRAAFLHDLNRFDVGVTALRVGTILLHLSRQQGWRGVFATEHHADNYLAELTESVASLQVLVPNSISAALKRMREPEPEVLARTRVASAETSFLTVQDRQDVLKAYRDAFHSSEPWVSAAVREPLEQFVQVGIRSALAQDIIRQIDIATPASEPRRSVHGVVFVGHRYDLDPGSGAASTSEPCAKDRIREAVEALARGGCRIVSYASAAPGGDILWHEVCEELGIDSTVCLPMPAEDFARLNFGELEGWRTRFQALLGGDRHTVLVLSPRPGLPRWLEAHPVDPRERATEWLMQMALAHGAERATLVALWKGESQGEAPGAAHMVRLAREVGIRVQCIDIRLSSGSST